MELSFILTNALLGVGLAMDAFSVSMANGLKEPRMRRKKSIIIAGTYGFFQFLMPMAGWVCVHTAVEYFTAFQKFIPWIALILLLLIGGKMLLEGIHFHAAKETEKESRISSLGPLTLLLQGIATSIDALSVGFTIAELSVSMALLSAWIIAAVTFIICLIGIRIGKKFGILLSGKASVLGGIILIAIGIEIFVRGMV